MIDRATIIDQVKSTLKRDAPGDARNDVDINRSFMMAVAEVSTRLKEESLLRTQTISVTKADRTETIPGSNVDITNIYYILYGTGDEQCMLEYVPLERFLKEYNSSETAEGIPTKYTFIGNNAGVPEIKFDCPASATDNIEVWYYIEPDENTNQFSKAPALVNLTMAYYYGTGNEKGFRYWQTGTNLIKNVRANAKQVIGTEPGFVLSKFDRDIVNIRWGMKERR